MQRELNLMGEISSEIKDVDLTLVRLCKTEQAAMRLCINKSRVFRTQRDLAALLDMSVGTLNTILNSDHGDRKRHMSRVGQINLQKLCGNRAIDQWAEMYGRGLLNHQETVEQRKAELRAELARLEEISAA